VSVVVPMGGTSVNFPIKTHPVASTIAVTLTATVDVARSTKVTVTH